MRAIDGLAQQAARFALVASQCGLGGGAVEHALPEFAARRTRGQNFGDAGTELGGKLGNGVEAWMQLALQPGP